MILERASNPRFVSNTYLLADGHGGPGFLIDAGGPVAGLVEAAERNGIEPTHVLLTHHHYDHVSDVPELRERWPAIVVLASPLERELLAAAERASGGSLALGEIGEIPPGAQLTFGTLEVSALPTPGHTAGMLSFLVRSPETATVFTGDTLFRDSVGGVRAPGHTTYADLKASIMDTLMGLPPQTAIEPGHAEETTVAREWDANPFIRVWRGLDPEGHESCIALGDPATLVLLAADYDGGTKAWVRWQDGTDDIVPGSKVQRPAP